MRLPKRDIIATALVGGAVVLYLLWLADTALPGMSGTRMTGIVILALGFAASASAVVPGFDQLIHGNKVYLAATASLGLVAFIAGVAMLRSASDAALDVVIVTMVLLWAISTVHHAKLANPHTQARSTRARTTAGR